jgi:hypothetical protein
VVADKIYIDWYYIVKCEAPEGRRSGAEGPYVQKVVC